MKRREFYSKRLKETRRKIDDLVEDVSDNK